MNFEFEHSTGSERVDASGLRAVEVIICMITRDFSVITMTSQASLSLSKELSLSLLLLLLTKVTHAQHRKRFRVSYNNELNCFCASTRNLFFVLFFMPSSGNDVDGDVHSQLHASQEQPSTMGSQEEPSLPG